MMRPFKCFLSTIFFLAAFSAFSQQVYNDDCTNAPMFAVEESPTCYSPISGTTLGATPSGIGDCGSDAADVWFSFVATATAHEFKVDHVYEAYGNYWPQNFSLELFSGSCDGGGLLQHLICLSNDVGMRFGELTPGDTYYLRVFNQYDVPINFQLCVTTPNPPPANDVCANAQVLAVESSLTCNTSVEGSTANATLNFPGCPDCNLHHDVWYSFTATQATQVLTLNNIKFTTDNSDAYIHVESFTGDCNSLVPVNRNDVFSKEGKMVFTDLTAGQTYFLSLYTNYFSDPPVKFNICVTAPPPPVNDDCAGAVEIIPSALLDCSEHLEVALLGATSSGDDCHGTPVNDLWYKFTAVSPSHRVALIPLSNDAFGFELYSGDCNLLQSIICADYYQLAYTLNNLTVGATYYLRVYNQSFSAFDCQLCVMTLPPPPVNDECAGALPLPVNPDISLDLFTTGTTLGATSSLPDCGGTESTHDVWYSFVASSVSQRILFQDNLDVFGNYQQIGFEVYQGDCDQLSSLTCGPVAPNYNFETLLGGLTPGATYYLRVYSWFGSNHNFTLYLQTLPPPPANEDCNAAETLISAAQPGCGTPAVGSTAGVVSSGNYVICAEGKELWYRFTATHPTHVVELSEVQTVFGDGNSFWLELYEGPFCSQLNQKQCFTNPEKVYLNQLVIGQTYFLHWVNAASAAQSFKLCLSHFDPPVNDACANALPLTVHGNLDCYYPTSANTAGSTPGQPAGCVQAGDVWFRFTAIQSTQRIVINNIASVENGSIVPLNAELFSGACGALNSQYCWSNVYESPFTLFAGDLIPGQTYYLRLSSQANIPARFDICVLTPPKPPVNDNCVKATVLIPETTDYCTPIFGNTEFATPTPGLPVPFGKVEGDVWYSFTAIQANTIITMPYINGYPGDSKAVVEVYASACGAYDLLSRQTIDNAGEVYLSNLNPGSNYYIRVYPESASDIGFYICLKMPATPDNDECFNALPLAVNQGLSCDNTQNVNTFGATQSQPTCDGSHANDVWYQFTAADATYRFELYPANNEGIGEFGGIEVYSGDCDQLVSLFCKTLPVEQTVFLESGFTAGATYYLRIWSDANTKHLWNLCAIALPPTPANDECSNATPLTVNTALPCTESTQGTTLSATLSLPGCSENEVLDTWYSFTATTASNLLEINTSGRYFGGIYPGYELLAGDCNAPQRLYCREYVGDHFQEVLSALTPGETYFIRVYSYNQEALDFSICLTALPEPANDQCAQATPVVANPDLHCNITYPGTTAGASNYASSPTAWYVLTANSSTLLFALQNVQTLFGPSNFSYLHYQILHGNSCDDLQLVNTYSPTGQIRVTGLIPGDTYYIAVYSEDINAAYSFDLCIQTPPPPPVNDDCAGALPLTPNTGLDCDIITHGSTAGIPGYNGYGNSCSSYWYLHNVYDMWYTFTATAPNHVLQASNISPVTGSGDGNFELDVLQSDDCESFTRLSCNSFDNKLYLQGLIPGNSYYVLVTSGEGVTHDFDLCITTYPIPANGLCENAVPLTVSATAACDASTAGTTFSASASGLPACGDIRNDVWYTFTAAQTSHTITVSNAVYPTGNYPTNFGVELYKGDCANLQNVTCRLYMEGSDQFTVGDLEPGAQYWLRVGYGDVNFDVCVTTPELLLANDNCSGAIALPVSADENCIAATSGTTENATASSLNPGVPYYPGGPQPPNDVWYSFTATQANHVLVLNNVNTGSYYLNASVYSGVCGALVNVSQQPYYVQDEQQLRLTNLQPGATYFVRLYNVNAQVTTFDICVVSLPTPPNDECAGAISLPTNTDLTCQQETSVATLGATQSAPGCAGEAVNDVWYQFVATGASYKIDISTEFYGNNGLFGLEVFDGDCTAPNIVLPCAEYNYDARLIVQNLVAGNTYFIRIYVPGADFKGLKICLRSLPAAPANDDCAQATLIQPNTGVTCDQVYHGTTLGASQSDLSCYGETTNDVWYQFVAGTSNCLVTLTTDGYPLESYGSLGLAIYAGDDCANLSLVQCWEYVGGSLLLLNDLAAGSTYYIRVFSQQYATIDFSLCLQTLPETATNDLCSTAIEVVPSADMQCAEPVSGSTAGLTGTPYSPYCYSETALWYHFKATSPVHFIQLQNVVFQYGSNYLQLGLYQGNCDYKENLYCNYEKAIFATNLTPGTDYYILVGGTLNSGARFDLCVLTPMPPVNDHCDGAVMLPVSAGAECPGKITGTNLGATGSYGFNCGTGPDVFYTFVAIGTEHRVEFSNVQPNIYPFVEVLTRNGDCGDWDTFIGCFSASSFTLSNLIPGKTYYLRIGSNFPSYCYFDICVTTPQPDLDILTVRSYNDGCKPGNNESIEVRYVNLSNGAIADNTAEFMLTVTGANNGTYGPITNPNVVLQYLPYYPYYFNITSITFSGVDLSNPGESVFTVTAVLPNDLDVANNTETSNFTSLPLLTYYRDADGDGYGNPAEPFENCYPTSGYVTDNSDCDDNAGWVYPGAAEICNGFDDDCNGLIDAADPLLQGGPIPDVSCPNNIVQSNDPGDCSALVQYTVTASDNCGYTVSQTEGLATGAAFPIGTTLNTFVVNDLAGNQATCSFSVEVQKTADQDLVSAYTIIGFNDVLLKNNTVQSGGIGLVNAAKKARLQLGTTVTATNTFVKAPILELLGGS